MKFSTDLYNKFDFEVIKILGDFLPDKIFDAHAHIYDSEFTPGISGGYAEEKSGVTEYKSFITEMLQNPRKLRLNAIPFPDKSMADISTGNLKKSDAFLLSELEKDKSNVGEIMVLPDESAEHIEKRLVSPAIRGFKCYYTNSKAENAGNCTIDEYLPESAWQVANERKMCITLHMVRDKALADEKIFRIFALWQKNIPMQCSF